MLDKHRSHLVLAAFVAAVVFFVCAVFDWSLGSTDLIAAGLLSMAAGFVLERAP